MSERTYLVNWCFAAKGKEFRCDFFDDDSCEFYAWEDRNAQAKADETIFIRAMMGDPSARKRIENHQREFSVTVSDIDPKLIRDILVLDEKLEKSGDITSAEQDDIDARLAPYFWSQVNPLLPTPLTP